MERFSMPLGRFKPEINNECFSRQGAVDARLMGADEEGTHERLKAPNGRGWDTSARTRE